MIGKIERIKKLIKLLHKYDNAYNNNQPLISDFEYDQLYFELQELEKETGIIYPNSPTQSIHYEVKNELRKVAHNHPLLSLDKTKDWDEFVKYFDGHNVVGMLKCDGLTCSLEYVDGQLVKAETRGDGVIGEDILHNAKVIASIPQLISYKEHLIVDGEIICRENVFNKTFAQDYANPRNFAAGSIRLLDSNECAKRQLDFIAWYVADGFNETNSFANKLEALSSLGFTVVPWVSSFSLDAKEFLIKKAEKEHIPIDGLVGRFDDLAYGEKLGATGHHLRSAYAFKFVEEKAQSTLKDIIWQVGRTGVITPVATYEPIDLLGSTIEKASLHNVSVMGQILGKPYIGQNVILIKAHDIIPQIVEAKIDMNNNNLNYLEIPTVCPCCGQFTKIIQENESKILVCENTQCPARLTQQLDHFCGKSGLDIKGLSLSTLNKLIDWNWISSISDIFELYTHRKEWITKAGFGVKSVDNILNAITIAKNTTLSKFLVALGIPLCGRSASAQLEKQFGSWDKFINAVETKFKFYSLPDFGPELHNSIINFDYTEAKMLVNKYIYFQEPKINDDSKMNAELTGKTLCITGTLSKKRAEIEADLVAVGAKVTSAVSKNTNYLVCNDTSSGSSKVNKALALRTPILTEEELYKLLLK